MPAGEMGWEIPDYVSPDGRFRVRWADQPTRGNLSIVQPRVVDERTGDVLLDGWRAATWDWDGRVTAATASTIELAMRKFPGRVHCDLVIDADARTYEIRNASRGGKGLDELREGLRFGGLRPAEA
jgi:hypothetical protein